MNPGGDTARAAFDTIGTVSRVIRLSYYSIRHSSQILQLSGCGGALSSGSRHLGVGEERLRPIVAVDKEPEVFAFGVGARKDARLYELFGGRHEPLECRALVRRSQHGEELTLELILPVGEPLRLAFEALWKPRLD